MSDEKRWYEFSIGLYVEATSEQEALDKLSPLLKLANTIDPEGDAQVVLEDNWPVRKDLSG